MSETPTQRKPEMKKSFLRLARQGLKCRSGMAATEFALLLPALTVLFFGMLETSDAMLMNRRVAVAVNTMADLAAQTEDLTYNDVDNLIDGVKTIIEPHDPGVLSINLVSVELDDDDNPVVHWSRNQDGNEPYTTDAGYVGLSDDTVLNENGSLIVVEMTYPYTPPFTDFFVKNPFNFTRQSVRWPRLSPKVQLCDNDGQNCTQ